MANFVSIILSVTTMFSFANDELKELKKIENFEVKCEEIEEGSNFNCISPYIEDSEGFKYAIVTSSTHLPGNQNTLVKDGTILYTYEHGDIFETSHKAICLYFSRDDRMTGLFVQDDLVDIDSALEAYSGLAAFNSHGEVFVQKDLATLKAKTESIGPLQYKKINMQACGNKLNAIKAWWRKL